MEVADDKKQKFYYLEIEIGNMSPPIAIKHLQKKRLKISVSELMTIIRFFPLFIGDLVPKRKTNRVYMFLLNLLDILEIIISSSFDDSKINGIRNSEYSHQTI